MPKGTQRICPQGHKYYKSTDCPACPVCEEQRRPDAGFLSVISAPARRALRDHNIMTLMDLSRWTEKELLMLHGIGPAALPQLRKALKQEGLSFKNT